MDPITAAIVAALAASAIGGLTEIGKNAIVDSYTSLKSLLQKKFGSQSEVAKSVAGLEANPDSQSRKGVLQEEVKNAKADQDPELVQAAQALLSQIKALPGGEQHIQTATGSYIAQSDRGSTSTVNVNQPKEQ